MTASQRRDAEDVLDALLTSEERSRVPRPPSLRRPRMRQTAEPIIVRMRPGVCTEPGSYDRDRRPDARDARRDRYVSAMTNLSVSVPFRNDDEVFMSLADLASSAYDGDHWTSRWELVVQFAQADPRSFRKLRTNAEFEGRPRGRTRI